MICLTTESQTQPVTDKPSKLKHYCEVRIMEMREAVYGASVFAKLEISPDHLGCVSYCYIA